MPTEQQQPKRLSIIETIANKLRDGIYSGAYAPGQRLVELELTEIFSVSRGSIRSVLAQLAREGLVESEPDKGSRVTTLNRQLVQEIFEIRSVVSGLAASLAAQRIDLGDHRQKLQIFRDLWDRKDVRTDATLHMRENAKFHDLITQISGNDRLTKTLTQLSVPAHRKYFQLLLTEKALANSCKQHKNIARAILAGDAQKAESLARAHEIDSSKILSEIAVQTP